MRITKTTTKVSLAITVLFCCFLPEGSVLAGYTGPNRAEGEPAASVSGSVMSCGGHGGWCGGSAYVSISGNDPLEGYSITAIEGTHNGGGFSCGGASCQVSLAEGSNSLTYWAVSSYGDTSGKGSLSVNVDSGVPNLSLSLRDPTGLNGWYTDSVAISVTASDSQSGVAERSVGWEGGGWFPNSVTVVEDGFYRISARAVDMAGNVNSISKLIKIDATPPNISYSYPSPDGKNDWYVTPLYIEATSQDVLSGLTDLQIIVDESEPDAIFGNLKEDRTGINRRSAVIESDGYHEILIRAFDEAGNKQEEHISLKVDTTPPELLIHSPMLTSGLITIEGTVNDDLSGLSHIYADRGRGWEFLNPDEGKWNLEIDTLVENIPDGYLNLAVKAYDRAGNMVEVTRKVLVFNTTWPFYTLVFIVLAIGMVTLFDPRPREWQKLALQMERIRYEFLKTSKENME